MENWRDNLPEELQTSTNLAKYDSVEAALKGFEEATGRLGRSITIPSEEASEEQWAEYRQKLQNTAPNLIMRPEAGDETQEREFWKLAGVPEKPEEYTPADGFEGLPDDYIANMREVAAKAGWTRKQFRATLEALSGEFATQQQAFNERKEADAAIVNKKFGLAKDQKMEQIKALAEQFADGDTPPAWLEDLSMLTAGDILFLNNIVATFEGKGPQVFKQPISGDAMTPEEIQQQQKDIRTRLLEEGHTMPREEYKRLTKKLVTLGEMLIQVQS